MLWGTGCPTSRAQVRIMGGRIGQVKGIGRGNFNTDSGLWSIDGLWARPYNGWAGTIEPGIGSRDPGLGVPLPRSKDYGGDTASTEVRNRGMHAERHRLVKPVGKH